MPLTAPTLSVNHTTPDTVRLTWTDASGGTAPYVYDLHRSETKGFAPAAGNRIAAATASPYDDSAGVRPHVFYYYKVVVTDAAPATATSNEVQDTLKSRGNEGVVERRR